MIVRADFNQIRLHSSWKKRKLGLGGVLLIYFKINFKPGPNAPQPMPDEILKFSPIQNSSVQL
jgi:hypothetical protein